VDSLVEQLEMTNREVDHRKKLDFAKEGVQGITEIRPYMPEHIEEIVEEFYQKDTSP